MPIEVETKDCTALSDAEIEEMADLCATGGLAYEVGLLSKQAQSWVLVTKASDNDKLKGFSFCTLERIGGTPSVLMGLASIARTSRRDQVLKAILTDQMRRAVLAFPDEDVLIATQVVDAAGFEALKGLHDIIPRPGHRANGEERAWGRRLAKRFGIESTSYDDRTFIGRAESMPCVFDHESSKPEKVSPEMIALLDGVSPEAGDSLVIFGWAMAEDLVKYTP